MVNKPQTKQNWTRYFVIMAVLVLIVMTMNNYDQQKRNERIKYMQDNCDFTIATVMSYEPRRSGISGIFPAKEHPQSIDFSYVVNNKKYKTHYTDDDYPIPEKYGPEKGRKFVAVYLAKEPYKCALLFTCPVKDSTDYRAYLRYFRIHHPKLKNW